MSTPAPSRTVRDLTGMLAHAAHVMTTRLTAALAEIGSSPRAHCVLYHAMEAERTQIQIAEMTDLDKTTMVVTVDELEREGLAERRPSTTDRRARIIAVTPLGEENVRRGQEIVDRVHAEVLGFLPEDQRQAFVDALARLVEGELSKPVECDRPVRRPRQSRK
ncbi:MarR family transcriptional regulator [Sphaerisporangium siamense]|uniref:DNA-binding MarR family transcriptional regulator n=1 Tax=Sphaerisporangium siamense TaxID=795645 RepID=A0A7W7DB98_9ACTN|nr:MarR family winged helix-turn-helix transcriptional regulator [Sphaerisporangium siamense]MBB4703679.1 DNA-binding MarR family transcriptional regulator [Sphaerisporangium siamense]GII82151.1 MarR family transcriptional regulator [Sphaerisporangium siamense]